MTLFESLVIGVAGYIAVFAGLAGLAVLARRRHIHRERVADRLSGQQ